MSSNLVRRNDLSGLFPTLRDDFFGPLQEQFDRMFDDFFTEFFTHGGSLLSKMKSNYFPRLDAYVKDGQFVVESVVAGLDPSDISVEVLEKDDVRCVQISGKGQSSPKNPDKQTAYIHRELRRSSFTRAVALPEGLKEYDNPEVSLKDGILRLTWQVEEKEQPKDGVRRTLVWGKAEGHSPEAANEIRQARREVNKLAGTDQCDSE